jgi:hypothetical protein
MKFNFVNIVSYNRLKKLKKMRISITHKNAKLRHLFKLSSCTSLLFTVLFLSSCQKEEKETNQELKTFPLSESNTNYENEGLMEFAPATTNPYTTQNMLAALNELKLSDEIKCDINKFNIRVTHKYIRFEPQDSIENNTLKADTTLILFDYPLDRKITKGGTYYKDPSLSENEFNFQWCSVPANKSLPINVHYTVLAELYLPEEDTELVQYYETEFDNCITKLVEYALKRTDNFDTTTYDENLTQGEETELKRKTNNKYTPKGRITLTDNVLNNNTGLRGVKVRVHRFFEVREQLTDMNGNFNIGHQFRYPVNYSIKWERNDFNIRSGRYGQAYFNGPYKNGDWELGITNGVSWFYGQVHRGAFDYYYNNPTGLRTPPTNGFLGSRIAFGVFDEKDRANYKRRQRNWFGPEIFMYTSENDGTGGTLIPNSLRLYETTIHELAHASHFNLSHWHYRNSAPMVKESWAVGVAWSFARLKYNNPKTLQDLGLQNHIDGFDVVNWGERKYTPLAIDLIDNNNQRANRGGNTDFPIDRVSGYTIRNIEDALVQKTTMNAWRDQLKFNKPAGVTDALLDELFLNYTPIR